MNDQHRYLKLLTESATGFLALTLDQNIYEYIAQQLKKLVPDAYILVNSFDEQKQEFVWEKLILPKGLLKKALNLLNKPQTGTRFPLHKEDKEELMNGEIVKFNGGLYEISYGSIPKSVAKTLEKISNLGSIHGMGFSWNSKLYGNAVLFMKKGTDLQHKEYIQTFLLQASISLQRRHAQQKLQKLNNKLEQRVQERTKELEKKNEQLRTEIKQRTKAEKKLQDKISEYERLWKIMVGREEKMRELKTELHNIQNDNIT